MKYYLLSYSILIFSIVLTSCSSETDVEKEGNIESEIVEENKNDFNLYFNQIKSFFITNFEFCEEVDRVEEDGNSFGVIGVSGNWLSGITIDSTFIIGDLTGDGKDEVIVQLIHGGGGCGGNIEFTQYYIIEGEGYIKNISNLNVYTNNPYETNTLTFHEIKDGRIYGSIRGVVGMGYSKYDDIYETTVGTFYYEHSGDGLLFYEEETND